jgi:hypothetical protein
MKRELSVRCLHGFRTIRPSVQVVVPATPSFLVLFSPFLLGWVMGWVVVLVVVVWLLFCSFPIGGQATLLRCSSPSLAHSLKSLPPSLKSLPPSLKALPPRGCSKCRGWEAQVREQCLYLGWWVRRACTAPAMMSRLLTWTPTMPL